MDDVIKTLDRYYAAFGDQKRDWDFFISLADYVNLMDEIPELKDITDELEKEENKAINAIREAEALATEELEKLSKKILEDY